MVSGVRVKPTASDGISWSGQQSDARMNVPRFQSFFLAFALCEWCIASGFAPTLAGADTTAPQLLSIGSLDSSMAGVCFDEALNPATATNPLNYIINNGDVSVTSVTLRSDGKSVVLFLNGFF